MSYSRPSPVWENISLNTERLKVFGGWIIKTIEWNTITNIGDRGTVLPADTQKISSITFMSDPLHQWDEWNSVGLTEEMIINLLNKGVNTNGNKD